MRISGAMNKATNAAVSMWENKGTLSMYITCIIGRVENEAYIFGRSGKQSAG